MGLQTGNFTNALRFFDKGFIMTVDTVSIVIPMYNNWHLTHAILFDILQYNSSVDEIILINNGCTEQAVFDGIRWWRETSKQLPQIRIYNIKENVGFLKACNKGVPSATGDVVILVSNDVRMQYDVASLARNVFKKDSKLIMGGILYENSTGWNEFTYKGKSRIFKYLEGWLLIFTKSAWEDVGGFDERYVPNDYEDVDISTSWLAKGYTLASLSSDKVRHLGAQTIGFSNERQALTERNREKFRKKWLK